MASGIRVATLMASVGQRDQGRDPDRLKLARRDQGCDPGYMVFKKRRKTRGKAPIDTQSGPLQATSPWQNAGFCDLHVFLRVFGHVVRRGSSGKGG